MAESIRQIINRWDVEIYTESDGPMYAIQTWWQWTSMIKSNSVCWQRFDFRHSRRNTEVQTIIQGNIQK